MKGDGVNTPSDTLWQEILRSALVQHRQGELAQAEALYRRVLELQPEVAEAHCGLGVIELAQGNNRRAIDSLKRVLRLQPANVAVLLNLAIACESEGLLREAETFLQRTLECEPDSALGHLKLATVLETLGRLDEAQLHAQAATRLSPENPEAYLCLGTILIRRNRLSDAVPFFNHAVQLNPSLGPCAASTLRQFLDEGVRSWENRLESNPSDFDALLSLAKIRYSERRPHDAVTLLERALAVKPGDPNARYALGFTQLLLGEFEQGWKNYEARFKTGQKEFPDRQFAQPRWTGENLEGRTILVFAEQGLGDTLQFLRYTSLIAERGSRIVLQCQPVLKPLIETCSWIQTVVAPGDPLPPFHFQIPLLSLPAVFKTSLESIPNRVPYLRVPGNAAFELPSTPPGRMKIGLVWAGNPVLQNDLVRSIPLATLSPLWSLPNASFFSLQVGPASLQLAMAPHTRRPIDLKPFLSDFAKTAAAVQRLDLVISVDTAVAHLGGTLGKPVWLLLPFAPEWRWLLDREDSPWYPTMRLYRQRKADDWEDVIERVRLDLTGKTAAKLERPV